MKAYDNEKIVLVGVQARSNSKRLPGKIYEKIGPNNSMLQEVYQRCSEVGPMPNYVYTRPAVLGVKSDMKLMDHCREKSMFGIFYEGEEDDLVGRYVWAAEELKASFVVRITSDCPLIPKVLIEQCIKDLGEVDYVSNTINRTFPDGYDVQGSSLKFLKRLQTLSSWEDREHPYRTFDKNEITRKQLESEGFAYRQIVNSENIAMKKLSVDTKEDLELVRRVYASRQTT